MVRSYEVPELRRRAISKSKECLFHDEEENVDVPTELESLIGKAMVFKVNIKKENKQNYGSAFCVMKILNDENIVVAYCSSFRADQENDLISKMIEEYGDEESDDVIISQIYSKIIQICVFFLLIYFLILNHAG
nr:uncharacterized protein LOC109189832 [Ipomoea batatas]